MMLPVRYVFPVASADTILEVTVRLGVVMEFETNTFPWTSRVAPGALVLIPTLIPYGNTATSETVGCALDPILVVFDRDPEYGPRAAAQAVQEMDNKQFGEKKLYVRPALKRSEREKELAHERLKYQISKKRCNLYVKNFPPETTEQDLFTLFSSYGEIDSIKLYG